MEDPKAAHDLDSRVCVCDETHHDYKCNGTVVSCDPEAHTCMVLLDGETEPREFRCDQLCCC